MTIEQILTKVWISYICSWSIYRSYFNSWLPSLYIYDRIKYRVVVFWNQEPYYEYATKWFAIPYIFSFQNKGVNSIDEKDCNIIQENIILAGAEIKDTTFLTQKMRTFLTKFGYPLYPTKALPKGAVIERLPAVNVSCESNYRIDIILQKTETVPID